MKAKTLCGLLMIHRSRAHSADSYYTARAYTPCPPGCVTLPQRQSDLYGNNIARFWSGSLWLNVVYTFEYDYDSLGLGQCSKRLQRLFSLETAGNDGRDYEARVAANW